MDEVEKEFNELFARTQQEPNPQSKKEEKKSFTYTQKYSNGQILAEAVIIGKEPCF